MSNKHQNHSEETRSSDLQSSGENIKRDEPDKTSSSSDTKEREQRKHRRRKNAETEKQVEETKVAERASHTSDEQSVTKQENTVPMRSTEILERKPASLPMQEPTDAPPVHLAHKHKSKSLNVIPACNMPPQQPVEGLSLPSAAIEVPHSHKKHVHKHSPSSGHKKIHKQPEKPPALLEHQALRPLPDLPQPQPQPQQHTRASDKTTQEHSLHDRSHLRQCPHEGDTACSSTSPAAPILAAQSTTNKVVPKTPTHEPTTVLADALQVC